MTRGAFALGAAVALVAGFPRGARADEPPARELDSVDVNQLADMNLESLLDTNVEVWSATKMAGKTEEVAAIVTVYTREDIRKWGYGSVAELLRHVIGFYVVDDYVVPNVAVRGVSGGLGAESSIIKVMIDGHSVAFRSTGGNFLGPELIPISAIERVEVIRGPASTLYGADAFLGVVNVVTRDGAALGGVDLSGSLNINGGNLGSGADISAGTKVGPANLLISYRRTSYDHSGLKLPSSSPAEFLPPYSSRTSETTGLVQQSNVGYAKLAYAVGNTTITLSAWASAIDREAAFSPWVQLANGVDAAGRSNENHVSLLQGHLAARVDTRINDKLELTLDALAFRGGPTPGDHIDVGNDIYSVKRQLGFMGFESNLEARFRITDRLTAIGGVGVVFDRETLPAISYQLKAPQGSSQAGSTLAAAATNPGTQDLVNPSGYVLAVWKPFDPELGLTGGFRYDNHNIYGSALSGRFGAVLTPTKDLHIKALYGNAFKAPSALLLYGVPIRSGDIIGNAELKPQYVHTFEAQISYKPVKYLTASTGVAYSYLIDKAEYVLEGGNKIARNLAQEGALSWETTAKFLFPPWVESYASFELNHTTRNPGGVGYRADLIGASNVIYPAAQLHFGAIGGVPNVPLRAGIELSYIGARRASDDNILEAGRSYTLDPYFMLGATLSSTGVKLIGEKETVFAAVGRNLTGVRGADPGFSGVDYPIAARSFMFQVRQQL